MARRECVIPAEAGIQSMWQHQLGRWQIAQLVHKPQLRPQMKKRTRADWIPASAGMTECVTKMKECVTEASDSAPERFLSCCSSG